MAPLPPKRTRTNPPARQCAPDRTARNGLHHIPRDRLQPPADRRHRTYRAFSDALDGGYEIGNPTARTEANNELDWGLHWQRQTFSVNFDLFGSYLPDYLYRTVVGTTTPPAPPPPGAVVYGYRAIEAFWGGEMNLLWQPAQDSWFHADRGQRGGHRSRCASPAAGDSARNARVRRRARLVRHRSQARGLSSDCANTASRNNPAPVDMPVFANTSAFTLGSLQAGFSWRRIRISCAVENLFNRNYHEYLSPPAAGSPASGDLIRGRASPVPAAASC